MPPKIQFIPSGFYTNAFPSCVIGFQMDASTERYNYSTVANLDFHHEKKTRINISSNVSDDLIRGAHPSSIVI